MKTHNTHITLMVLLLVLFVVACGSEAASTNPEPETTSETEETVSGTSEETERAEETTSLDEASSTEVEVIAEPEDTNMEGHDDTETESAELTSAPIRNLTEGCVEKYDETIDYFPQKTIIEEASGLAITYHNHYKVIDVTNPWRDADVAFQYVLVQCGTPTPKGFDDALVIQIPVNTVIAMSTTQLPHLDELGELDSLVALDGFSYVNNENVRKKIDAGELIEIGSGTAVNVEATLELEPDLVMTYGTGSPDYDTHPVLLEAGIPTVLNSEYREGSPLGRAEWLKFTAAFFNKETLAQELFSAQQTRYNELVALTKDVEERPTVLINRPFNGTWYMSGGNSYVAAYLADAGTDYLWADDENTGTIPLDFETVLERASQADYWLNTGSWLTLEDGLAEDERFAEFEAFQNGNVYNNNARLNENGGNEYWELGVTHPEMVLADLIKIFHPELLPDHELVFYHHLGNNTE